MSFDENVRLLQRKLRSAGYESVLDHVDLSGLSKKDKIEDCEIIARKEFFNVMYIQAESNWRRIASEVARRSRGPCLVITRYRDSHYIFTTVRDHGTLNAKPRYVILETGSKPKLMQKFMQAIKAGSVDDHIAIDRRVQVAFDKFSEYRQAVDEFGKNLADIIKKTESAISKAIDGNQKYETQARKMLKMCREVISDQLDMDDIKSMLLQHILTYRIFALVYDVTDFHETNTVARSLEDLKRTLNIQYDKISYKTIELIAESLTETYERQEFLKKIYETFYKKYDPDRADKDGIVYTPSEAVNFMVKSTEELLQRHFGKSMSDDGVTLLDPATGTGTFIVHIMKQIGSDKIRQKYAKDLNANELSILPYYIAALNIEHAYKEMTGEYSEFKKICWIDTLNSEVKDYAKLTAYFDNDNIKRASQQQKSHIHVAIGNPPYNAIQASFNNANPADKYNHIDEGVRHKYYKNVQIRNKGKSFDMYKRFLKWSSDRIDGNGMVVFISNNSFLDAKADSGVRRALYNEFDYIYVVNLKGNARLCGDAWRREGGKLFGGQARVGVCISFFIKNGDRHSKIQYAEVADYMDLKEKLRWLDDNTVLKLESKKELKEIVPDKNSVWLNQTDSNFQDLVPVVSSSNTQAIFGACALGVGTAKNDWVYDLDHERLERKMRYYITVYNSLLEEYERMDPKPTLNKWVDKRIKWSRTTLRGLERRSKIKYSKVHIRPTLFRPFVVKQQYHTDIIIENTGRLRKYFPNSDKNLLISFPNPKTNVVFNVIGADMMTDLDCVDGTQNIPLWTYDNGKRNYNITNYGLDIFQKHYKNEEISKEEIFYYTYAIFNDPKYNEKYHDDLAIYFPRIPLAKDFVGYTKIGKRLFKLHCGFGKSQEYDLCRVDKKVQKNTTRLSFKQDKNDVRIVVDDVTTIVGVPLSVLHWTLKCKTPLEWLLEFYKEKKNLIGSKSSDSLDVRRKFDTYCFQDHKEELITLLRRVTTVCVETVKMREQLKGMEWGAQKIEFTPITREQKTAKKTERKRSKSKPTIRYQKKLGKGGSKMQSTFK